MTSSALGQLSNQRRRVGSGRELGEKLLDSTFAPVRGSAEEGLVVLLRQVRGELSNARQMKPTVTQHFQEERMPPRCSRRGDALVGFVLREVQHVGGVGEHRRAGLPGI